MVQEKPELCAGNISGVRQAFSPLLMAMPAVLHPAFAGGGLIQCFLTLMEFQLVIIQGKSPNRFFRDPHTYNSDALRI